MKEEHLTLDSFFAGGRSVLEVFFVPSREAILNLQANHLRCMWTLKRLCTALSASMKECDEAPGIVSSPFQVSTCVDDVACALVILAWP